MYIRKCFLMYNVYTLGKFTCTCTVQYSTCLPGPGNALGGATESPLSTREKNAALASRLAKSV